MNFELGLKMIWSIPNASVTNRQFLKASSDTNPLSIVTAKILDPRKELRYFKLYDESLPPLKARMHK